MKLLVLVYASLLNKNFNNKKKKNPKYKKKITETNGQNKMKQAL